MAAPMPLHPQEDILYVFKPALAGRAQLGAMFGGSLLGTPRDYLFYSGGGGTVRGQPYQALGVEIARIYGDKIGGMFGGSKS